MHKSYINMYMELKLAKKSLILSFKNALSTIICLVAKIKNKNIF